MKKKMIMVLDVETCPIEKSDKVDAKNMLVYDIGYSIVDLKEKVYIERSFIVADVFFGQEDKMQSAYYANKLPQYKKDIANGKRKVRTWEEIRWIIQKDISDYGVNVASAHNSYFDYTSCNATKRFLNKNYLIPYGIEWWDSLKMVQSTLATKKSYQKFCQENDFLKKNGQPRCTIEICWKYLTNDLDFVESHTGLEDVQIEREIMFACFRMHKKMNRKLWKD